MIKVGDKVSVKGYGYKMTVVSIRGASITLRYGDFFLHTTIKDVVL